MSKRKVSVADKIYAVNLYLDGKESQRRIADMFDVSLASVQQWISSWRNKFKIRIQSCCRCKC
ncbi:MAG: helix-turn-helix domain-containing protein [Ruminococcus sp.]